MSIKYTDDADVKAEQGKTEPGAVGSRLSLDLFDMLEAV